MIKTTITLLAKPSTSRLKQILKSRLQKMQWPKGIVIMLEGKWLEREKITPDLSVSELV